MKKKATTSVLILLFVITMATTANAVPIAFSLDSSQSYLELVATYSNFTLMEQGSGSLTTSYSGIGQSDHPIDYRISEFDCSR